MGVGVENPSSLRGPASVGKSSGSFSSLPLSVVLLLSTISVVEKRRDLDKDVFADKEGGAKDDTRTW